MYNDVVCRRHRTLKQHHT